MLARCVERRRTRRIQRVQAKDLGGLGRASGVRPNNALVRRRRNVGALDDTGAANTSGKSAAAQHVIPARPLQQRLSQSGDSRSAIDGAALATSAPALIVAAAWPPSQCSAITGVAFASVECATRECAWPECA
jgi:hypothetical protein